MKSAPIRVTRVTSPGLCDVGEGPVWDERIAALYFVDITGGLLHRYVPGRGELVTRDLGIPVGCVALTHSPGILLVTHGLGLWRYDWDAETLSAVATIEGEPDGNRCNDGKPDPRGRFWVGTMENEGKGMRGSLHVFSVADGRSPTLHRVTGPFGISNGLGWSPDGRWFYHIDSVQRRVDRYAFDISSGRLGPRETAVDLSTERGLPDGMTVDAEGRLWIAMWGGGGVTCFAPGDSTPQVIIDLPCAQVASCEFGGTDFRDLYITTARRGLDAAQRAAQPEAGAVYVCQPGARGLRAHHVVGVDGHRNASAVLP